jgi:hypothetical protein
MAGIKQLNSKVVYKNKWMKVREDVIIRPSGRKGLYGVVEKPDFVVILPIDGKYIHLVEQYRYPVGARYWELPQGCWDSSPDSESIEVAKGELQEETGLISGNLQYVGYQYLAYGYSTQGYHIYIATDLKMSSQNLDAEEEDLITKKVTLIDFKSMIINGIIKDSATVTAYSLAKLKNLIP